MANKEIKKQIAGLIDRIEREAVQEACSEREKLHELCDELVTIYFDVNYAVKVGHARTCNVHTKVTRGKGCDCPLGRFSFCVFEIQKLLKSNNRS